MQDNHFARIFNGYDIPLHFTYLSIVTIEMDPDFSPRPALPPREAVRSRRANSRFPFVEIWGQLKERCSFNSA